MMVPLVTKMVKNLRLNAKVMEQGAKCWGENRPVALATVTITLHYIRQNITHGALQEIFLSDTNSLNTDRPVQTSHC